MIRFLVFAYNDHYPRGGMGDCVYKSSDYIKALKKAQEYEDEPDILEQMEYVCIYDIQRDRMVYEFERVDDTDGVPNGLHHAIHLGVVDSEKKAYMEGKRKSEPILKRLLWK